MHNDTIIAQSTSVGLSAIGVIRISGELVRLIAKKILGRLPPKRYATYTKFKNLKGEILDFGIAIFFSKPNSYTGEDILELHTHGNQIIIEIIIKEIINISNNIRLALTGEFTKRAWLNNKIDLIQAEAINDIINATSEISIKYTLNNLNGKFSEVLKKFFEQLRNIKKNVEYLMSFENSEEEDNNTTKNIIFPNIKFLIRNIQNFLSNIKINSKIKRGFKVVIAGRPNVGKSSIFNAILGYERAIVTNLKGTTRDILSEFIYLKKIPIYLIDTAGIRNNVINTVEKKGISLTMKQLKEADCIIYIIDYKKLPYFNIEIEYLLSVINTIPFVCVINKIEKSNKSLIHKSFLKKNLCIYFSKKIKKKEIETLLKNLSDLIKVRYLLNKGHKNNFYANKRHSNYLNIILKHLKNVIKLIKELQFSINDMCVEELSIAEKMFEELFGKKIYSNGLLNDIFKSFCVGK